jgi:hypothetical protein
MIRPRFIAMAIISVIVAAFFAYGPPASAATRRHAPAHHRAVHIRQIDVNDIAGLGAWRGCATTAKGASGQDSRQLAALYCARAPMGLA